MSTTIQETSRESNLDEATGTMQLVSFRLAQEEYGVEITKVREIILMGEITRVPQTPPYVKGLINLRSTVIPVIDLRVRFGLSEDELTGPAGGTVVDPIGHRPPLGTRGSRVVDCRDHGELVEKVVATGGSPVVHCKRAAWTTKNAFPVALLLGVIAQWPYRKLFHRRLTPLLWSR